MLAPAIAYAAPLTVQVRDAAGLPIAGAVVMVESSAQAGGAFRMSGPAAVAQRNIAFDPHVLIVPVGTSVSFPNLDRVRHHVYSFSAAKKFELKLYGKDEGRSVVFDKPGIVALGCNIHDSMSGFVVVTKTPFAGQTDAAGRLVLDVPAAPALIRVWHPSLRAKGNEIAQQVSIPAAGLNRTVQPGRP